MARNISWSAARLTGVVSLSASLFLGLLTPTSAQALVLIRPATIWGNVYAGSTSATPQKAPQKVALLEAKSKIIVDYFNFPEWTKIQVQAAVDVWAANFESNVPIRITATWGRSTSSTILGSARPGNYFANFSGAPDPSLWYPSALANALAGEDLDADNPEMFITVNSLANWSRGSGPGPSNTEYDLHSVILHEMAHGLGFLSNNSYDKFFGYGTIEEPTAFDAYVQTEDGRRLSDLPSPSLELGKALTAKLVWSGVNAVTANGGEKPIIYAPTRYEEGSSVSHLDEATFTSAGADSVMTPNLDAGEVFHEPGPLLLAMMQDLRSKPPVGIAVGIPQQVRNAQAVTSAASAIIKFDPPANARTAQVTSYTVKNLKTGAEQSTSKSPVVISGLKNGITYSFEITAANSLGISEPVTTNAITPQRAWAKKVIDPNAEVGNLTTATFNTNPAIIYQNTRNGSLKLALWNGKNWRRLNIDGIGGGKGRTRNSISGDISVCVSGYGKRQALHIFYADSKDKDLRYAKYDGGTFKYEVVDGNGPVVNSYESPIRVRTASDVSISNACSVNSAGVQVFYRDESQGILLGAVKESGMSAWRYELVDGDRKTDGRTTGDVAFNLDALFDGKKTILLYDSVSNINQHKEIMAGEIRLAQRTGISPSGWIYSNIDSSAGSIAVAGYDVVLQKGARGVLATWLTSSSLTLPKADQIRWAYLSEPKLINSLPTIGYGTPSKILSTNGNTTVFNCEGRLCAADILRRAISLVTKAQNEDGYDSGWIVLNSARYLVAGVAGELVTLKQR